MTIQQRLTLGKLSILFHGYLIHYQLRHDSLTERIQQLKLAAEIDKKDSELELKRFSEEDNFFDFEEADLEKYDNETFEEFTYEEAFESDSYGV